MDVIVAAAEPAALAAKNATSSVPIVILLVGDLVGSKLVASLTRPGGNVTGMTFTPTLTLLGKRLALLKEVVRHASRIAILSKPANPSHARELKEVEAAAPREGSRVGDLEKRLAEALKREAQAQQQQTATAEILRVISSSRISRSRACRAALSR